MPMLSDEEMQETLLRGKGSSRNYAIGPMQWRDKGEVLYLPDDQAEYYPKSEYYPKLEQIKQAKPCRIMMIH